MNELENIGAKEILLEGKRINLRPLLAEDAESIAKYAGNDDIARFSMVPHPYTLADARSFIQKTNEEITNNKGFSLTIEHKANQEAIGMMSLIDYDPVNKMLNWDIGLVKNIGAQGLPLKRPSLFLTGASKRMI